MSEKYTIQKGFVILDENLEVVDWFDTEDEAEDYVNELEIMNNK